MKRMRPHAKAALFAGIILFALCLFWAIQASEWQPLRDGGRARVFAITKGPAHTVTLPQPTFTTKRIRSALRTLSLTPLKNAPAHTFNSTQSHLRVWVEVRGTRKEFISTDSAIILSDGRRLQSNSSGCSFSVGTRHHYSDFRYVPYGEKTIRFVCRFGDQTIEFTRKNPFYRKDFLPVWTNSPLPQTKSNGDLELTLQTFTAAKQTFPPPRKGKPDWVVQSAWSIKKGRENADTWFRVRTEFEDPAGQRVSEYDLVGEPVWKVCADLRRTNKFPFREDEVSWLGIIAPDAPREQTYRLLPLRPAGSTFQLAGVFGAGRYSIREDGSTLAGFTITVQPPPETPPKRHERIYLNSGTKTVDLALDKPGVVVVGSALVIVRDLDGRLEELDEDWSHGGFAGVDLYHLPKTPIRIGTANPGSWKFEFLVDAPKRPAP